MQWVSTTTAPSIPKISPITRLAVFLPIPGSAISASRLSGTSPSYCSHNTRAIAMISLDLVLYRPQDLIYSASSSGVLSAKSRAQVYRSNSAGVTIFTRASVHWADSRVATRHCSGSVYCSEQIESGYSALSASTASRAICFFVISITSLLQYSIFGRIVQDGSNHDHPSNGWFALGL